MENDFETTNKTFINKNEEIIVTQADSLLPAPYMAPFNLKTDFSSINTSNVSSLNHHSSEIEIKKKQKIDEYSRIEERQAKLLKLLNERIYTYIIEESKAFVDIDELHRVFYVVTELKQLALLVHEPIASEIKRRIEIEWVEKPYFGDILIVYYHYYKVYKAILARYPTCQYTLSSLLKKKNFATPLKKLLVFYK